MGDKADATQRVADRAGKGGATKRGRPVASARGAKGGDPLWLPDAEDWVTWVRRITSGANVDHLAQEFRQLGDEQKVSRPNLTTKASEANKPKNRYLDVSIWDQTRVVLEGKTPDYIHASYVDGFKHPKEFILAQGPLETTIIDFWDMVWQNKVSIIVMLCQLKEDNRPKCANYWKEGRLGPYTINHVKALDCQLDKLKVTQLSIEKKEGKKKGERRLLAHFLFEDWPDRKVPLRTTSMTDLWQQILKVRDDILTGQKHLERKDLKILEKAPTIIHCSAGIGRSGTLLAVQICIEGIRHTGKISVQSVVRRIRTHRKQAVQTLTQYLSIYMALLNYLHDHHSTTEIDIAGFAAKCNKAVTTVAKAKSH